MSAPLSATQLAMFAPYIASDETYWQLVRDAWQSDDAPSADLAIWRYLLEATRPRREAMMSEFGDDDEPLAFRFLPDPVPVFRGFDRDGGERGLSWTTDRTMAQFFALRSRRCYPIDPRIAIGTVAKSSVIAYLLDLQESEIVALPENVAIERIEAVQR